MKARIFVILIAVLFMSHVSIGISGWSAINSGYAVTTDFHGADVFAGMTVTATAGTTDSDVLNVTFLWKFPNETVAFEDEVVVSSNGTTFPDENGSLVLYAQSNYAPTMEGKWGVQAFFNGPEGRLRGNSTDIVSIKATSVIIIPEFSPLLIVPFFTLTTFLAMMNRKRKHTR